MILLRRRFVARTEPLAGCKHCLSRKLDEDALWRVEDAVRIVLGLDLREPRQVRSVIRALPVGEVGVDVVDVSAGRIRRHRRAQIANPGDGRRRRGVIPPVGLILQIEERPAVNEGRCGRIDGRDSPTQRKEPHQIRGEGRGAQMLHQGRDRLGGERIVGERRRVLEMPRSRSVVRQTARRP